MKQITICRTVGLTAIVIGFLISIFFISGRAEGSVNRAVAPISAAMSTEAQVYAKDGTYAVDQGDQIQLTNGVTVTIKTYPMTGYPVDNYYTIGYKFEATGSDPAVEYTEYQEINTTRKYLFADRAFYIAFNGVQDVQGVRHAELTVDSGIAVSQPQMVNICHYDYSTKMFSELTISMDTWSQLHRGHSHDFFKIGSGSCDSQTPEEIKQCTTDRSPLNYFIKGVTCETHDGVKYCEQDICTADGNLRKYYCYLGSVRFTPGNCQYGCSDGACNLDPDTFLYDGTHSVPSGGMVQMNNGIAVRIYFLDTSGVNVYPVEYDPSREDRSNATLLRVGGFRVIETDARIVRVTLMSIDGDTKKATMKFESLGAEPNAPQFLQAPVPGTAVTPPQNTSSSVVSSVASRLRGYILLQVENHGEAYYVDPVLSHRFYLKDGAAAYTALRQFGLGVTDADLMKIPVGSEPRFVDTDSDNDGLPDKLEEGLKTDPYKADSDDDGVNDGIEVLVQNTNPLSSGAMHYSSSLVDRLKGKILLQVESKGEAWYLNPKDGKRYYMKNGDAAYQIMRFLSLGITNADLEKILE